MRVLMLLLAGALAGCNGGVPPQAAMSVQPDVLLASPAHLPVGHCDIVDAYTGTCADE